MVEYGRIVYTVATSIMKHMRTTHVQHAFNALYVYSALDVLPSYGMHVLYVHVHALHVHVIVLHVYVLHEHVHVHVLHVHVHVLHEHAHMLALHVHVLHVLH